MTEKILRNNEKHSKPAKEKKEDASSETQSIKSQSDNEILFDVQKDFESPLIESMDTQDITIDEIMQNNETIGEIKPTQSQKKEETPLNQSIVSDIGKMLDKPKGELAQERPTLKDKPKMPQDATKNSSTGIKEFDELIQGGFPKGAVMLLAGSAGSGKTIFSFEWLFHGTKQGENGIEQQKLKIIDLRERFSGVGYSTKEILDYIEGQVKEQNAKRVCIDSITAIAYQYNEKSQIRAFIFELGKILATLGVTTVLISEVSDSDKYSVYDVEEFISDAILRFDQIRIGDQYNRYIKLVKMRGKNFTSEAIPLKISEDGISLYPKKWPILSHPSFTDRISTGNKTLDEIVRGGVIKGTSILIAGATGTGKTLLSLQYIFDGLNKGEKCAYFGFEESKEQIIKNAEGFGWNIEEFENKRLLHIRCKYPSDCLLEEHFKEIRRIIEDNNIVRCVVDSLSALNNAFNEEELSSFSIRLNGYFKNNNITTYFTSNTGGLLGSTEITDNNLSTLADCIIMLRYVEMQGRLESVMSILKMRGSSHDKDLRKYSINEKGVEIGESLTDYEGVMTGSGKKIRELQEESERLKNIIEEKDRTENQLKKSKQETDDILNAAADGIRVIGKDFIVMKMNSTMEKMTGINESDGVGMKCEDMFKSKDCGTDECSLVKVLKTEQSHQRESVRTKKDDATIHVLEKFSPYKDGNGNIVGIVEDFRDITPIKEKEAELKEAQKVLTIVNKHLKDKIQLQANTGKMDATQLVDCFDSTPKKIFQKDTDYKYINANDQFLKDYNLNHENLIGKTDFDIYPPDKADKLRSEDLKILQSGNELLTKDTMQKDGVEILQNILKTPIKDNEGNIIGILGFMWEIDANNSDITEKTEPQIFPEAQQEEDNQ
jgi:circadian clock protein KaiC